jgi:ABC-2 type transport system ATP-binding protein
MIFVQNLTKLFPGVIAVDDISFSVERGEIVGFLGPNGAGKTTTMRILTCFIPPTSGNVKVAGFDVIANSIQVRRRVGYLAENNPLYTEARVSEYLNFRAKIKGISRVQRRKAIEEAMERCGLKEIRKRIIGQLSKGLRQRVGLADAIVHDPEILILDEPTIGLDPNQVREVRALIRELAEKKTVILSTHILSEVELMCNKVIIIHQGRIAAEGSIEEITRKLNLIGRVKIEIRGQGGPVKEVLDSLENVKSVHWMQNRDIHTFLIETKDHIDIREELYRLAVTNNWSVRELSFEKATLEDAFVELTHSEKVL